MATHARELPGLCQEEPSHQDGMWIRHMLVLCWKSQKQSAAKAMRQASGLGKVPQFRAVEASAIPSFLLVAAMGAPARAYLQDLYRLQQPHHPVPAVEEAAVSKVDLPVHNADMPAACHDLPRRRKARRGGRMSTLSEWTSEPDSSAGPGCMLGHSPRAPQFQEVTGRSSIVHPHVITPG